MIGAFALLVVAQVALVVALVVSRTRRRKTEGTWREIEDRHRIVVEAQGDLVCRYLPDTMLTYVNESYARFWKKRPEDLIGTRFLELIPAAARDDVQRYVDSLFADSRVDTHENEVVLVDGTIGWQQWINHPIVDPQGRLVEFQGVGRDVTARKRAEAELRSAASMNHAILQAIPDVMFLMNKEGVYLDYHAKDSRDLYVPPEHFLGRNMRDVLPADLVALLLPCIAKVPGSGEPCVIEYELPIGGEVRHYEARLVACESDTILTIVRDVTERTRTVEALQQSELAREASYRRVRDLAGRLIGAQEAERSRIARDLHDDLSQKLALLSIDIEQLGQTIPSPTEAIARRFGRLTVQAGEIASEVHRLSHRLHPSTLQALGLVNAVRSFCREFAGQHHLQVEFQNGALPPGIPPDVALCIFRIVQEALQNVAKHSGTDRASVRLMVEADDMVLGVADPGQGFDLDTVEGLGLGLISMRERVSFLGGQITINSTPGRGTRIDVRVPLRSAPPPQPPQIPSRQKLRF